MSVVSRRRRRSRVVYKPRWWTRVNMWVGLLFVASSAIGWLTADAGLPPWRSWLYFALGVVLLLTGWVDGVAVDDVGIRVRRLARRRTATWEEIDYFTLRSWPRAAAAALPDGSYLRLVDQGGDQPRLVMLLEAERKKRQPRAE